MYSVVRRHNSVSQVLAPALLVQKPKDVSLAAPDRLTATPAGSLDREREHRQVCGQSGQNVTPNTGSCPPLSSVGLVGCTSILGKAGRA
jgi:hypothetical protein